MTGHTRRGPEGLVHAPGGAALYFPINDTKQSDTVLLSTYGSVDSFKLTLVNSSVSGLFTLLVRTVGSSRDGEMHV